MSNKLGASQFFAIDANTGVVTVAGSLDYETDTSHAIEVTATSSDGTTSTQTFTIAVGDVNEHDVSSISDTDTSANTIAEDVSNGGSVGITASASDADGSNNTVTYSLSDDASGIFTIDATTGEVSIADASGIDYENATSHTIEVTATSQDGSTSTQNYTIDVTDIDEFDVGAVSDTDTSANTIAENAIAGDEVGVTASATDGDATNSNVSYSVDDARFDVATDGTVTVASGVSFDAETEGSIDIVVTATSEDGSTSTQNYTIDVTDIDEFDVGAVSDTDTSANGIDEDASVGDTVGITALATDGDVTDNVTYTLSDDASGLFDIDANTGVVTVAGSLDAETNTSHTIEVTATSDDGSTSTQTFSIGVNDVNETSISAISDNDGSDNTVTEGASVGTAVGITALATDADATDTISYSLSSNPGGFFAIDANTGVVTVAGSLDYETDTSHAIEVTATSSDGTTSTQTFTIAVGDVNEHDVSSISDTDTSANTIAEDVSNGGSVGITASASDADGSNNTVTYSLSDDASGIFTIDATTGEVSIADASGIDYENATSHTIEVTATSEDGSTSTQNYTINVTDIDEFDVGAVSDTDTSANTIAENAIAGDEVGVTASATDGDATNSNVSYSVDDARFDVATDGTVTVASGVSFDAETEGSIDIVVTATSEDGSTSTQNYTIDVTDIDEFDVGAVSDTDTSANGIDEDASVGDTVGITALATDGDVTDNVTYTLSDDASGLFDIDANTGVVTVAGSLDAETNTSHTIEVTATSDDGSTSTQTFAIGVNDVNETSISAISDNDGSDNTVTEGASVGTAVGITALATDADATDTISYSLSSNPGGFFAIDANTGEVTVAGSLDYETDTSHAIEVTATSSDGTTSTQTFTIAVGDVNEHYVSIISDTDTSANTIAEDVSNGDSVGITASATDADGSNNTVTYSLSDDASGIFTIDASTGEVSIADASGIDYENATSHTIEVTATSQDGSTSTQNYTIDVTDIDEFDVGAVTDTNAAANGIDEDASVGDTVGITALATDGDVTDNVTYTLSDDASGLFDIDANTGVVTVAGSLDAETNTSHTIEVTATSDDGSTSTQTFAIGVNDVNETSISAISDNDGSDNTVTEGASVGTAVGITALATDADATDTISYSLSSNPGGFFAIDANTGVVTVAGSLDYETDTSHAIEVTATSSDGTTSTQTFTIAVGDVNEHYVSIISDTDTSANTIAEDVSNGDSVGITASATDADGSNNTVTYSLSDDASGIFTIDASTGEVSIADASGIDYENATSHTIEVTATSQDGSTSTQNYTIDVTDIDEFDVGAVTDTNAAANGIDEDASVGDTVGITALATDGDVTDNVTYTLSDDASGLFDIDANTGVVTVAGSLDAETNTSHTIEVTATSDDGSTSTQTFAIGVNDVNETSISAISDNDGSGNSVTEGASVGTAVGITALATDADATDTISYSLSSNPGGFFAIDANTGEVTVAGSLDYETDTSHAIEVTATSSDGTTSTQTFTIAVGDEAENVQLADGGVTFTDSGVTETSVSGGSGDDTIAGSSGDDVIAGNAGDDVVNAGDGNDKFDDSASGNGNDTVNMGAGDDYAYGGDGSDVIDGGTGEDFIHGEDGNDTLTGGADDDTIRGGDGVDIAVFSGDRADYTISHSESPYYDGGVWTITGPDGTDTVMEVETFRFDDGDYSAADLQQTADQTIVGTVNDDILNGGSGNDTISGLAGDDVVNAGDGDDRFDDTSVGNGNDTLNMGAGNDIAYGGDGTDTIKGDDGDDKLYGEAGDDTIIGGEGYDTIDGGADDDTVVFSGNWADYTITQSGSTFTVVDDRPGSPDGTDTVTNVEYFEFADGTTTADDVIDVGPSDIDVSATSIDENSSSGTVVATLTATDNSLDVQSYTITNDPSGFFEISGDQIVVKSGADIDFEDATSHDISIEVSDGAGSTYSETVTINIADVNEAPTDITFSVNSDLDISGGNPTTVDAVVTGEIVSSGSNSSIDHFEISHNGGELTIDGLADGLNGGDLDMQFELLRDNGDGTYTSVGYNDDGASGTDGSTSYLDSYLNFSNLVAGDYLLAVGNINFDQSDVENTSSDYPTGYWNGSSETGEYQVTISGDATVAIAQNPDFGGTWGDPQNNISIVNDGSSPATLAAGSVIGSAESVADVDAGDTFTYALADDADGKFEIDADTGEIALVAEHDASTAYSDTVDVQVTDSGGNTYTETVGIQLGTEGNDVIVGATGSDIIHGFEGADYINGNGGNDSVSAGGGVSSENLIVNGSFEANDVGAVQQSTSFDGWTASSGAIEIGDESYSAYGGVNASDGEQFVEMNANTAFDSFYQDVATNDGEIYNLSLDVALRGGNAAGDNGVEVYWNGELIDTIEPDSNSMETYTFEVVGTGGADRLEFAEPGGTDGGSGVLFDNVALVSAGDFVTTGSGDDTLVAGDGTPGEVEELTLNDTATDGVASVSNLFSVDLDEISYEVNLTVDNIPSSGANIVSYATMDGSSMHDNEFTIMLNSDGSLRIIINQTSSVNTGPLETDLADGSEHRLSVTWDNSDGGIKVYVDGVEEYSVTGIATNNMIDGGGTLTLGQEQDSVGGSYDTNQIFSGTMDDVRIFNDVRTATEIADNHDSQLADPSSTSNLVANWQFDGESGSTVTDLANFYDLTLTGDASLENGPVEGGTLNGGSGNDTITGGDGNDTLDGGDGKDTLDGGAGDDILMAGFDDGTGDIFIGGEGNDTYQIEGSAVENYAFNVDLNTGTDQYGNSYSGIENINGGNGNDTFTGDANANTFNGGAGNDTMYGGDESDIFVFGEGDGADTAHGGAGGGWTDTIELSDAGGDLGTYGTDWTVSLTSGSIDAQDANSLTLSDDADGTITLADGSTVDFFEIERIEF